MGICVESGVDESAGKGGLPSRRYADSERCKGRGLVRSRHLRDHTRPRPTICYRRECFGLTPPDCLCPQERKLTVCATFVQGCWCALKNSTIAAEAHGG